MDTATRNEALEGHRIAFFLGESYLIKSDAEKKERVSGRKGERHKEKGREFERKAKMRPQTESKSGSLKVKSCYLSFQLDSTKAS